MMTAEQFIFSENSISSESTSEETKSLLKRLETGTRRKKNSNSRTIDSPLGASDEDATDSDGDLLRKTRRGSKRSIGKTINSSRDSSETRTDGDECVESDKSSLKIRMKKVK